MKFGLLAIAICSLCACSEARNDKIATTDDSIIVGASSQKTLSATAARWSIEVWNGPSITGDPKDHGYFLSDADTLLLNIVAECRLGATYRNQATDGILLLAIKNADLTSEQLRCIRSKERKGLRLVESELKN
jgi:hypothetical protein